MTFEELGVREDILHAIGDLGFVEPMPIQHEVIPYLLENKSDVIALAQTGTGKTAAFGIPLLQRLVATDMTTQALVMAPTRELCLQITDDLRSFARYIPGVNIVPVYGGTSVIDQIHQLRRGAQVIVATPGRLIDLIERKAAHVEMVSTVVLDEADEMLNMGFEESISRIFEELPDTRQTLLFSATMSKEIEKIAKKYLHEYREIVVGSRNEGAEHVDHIYYMVHARDRYAALKRVVDYYPRIYAIIFCRTKAETQEVADQLIRDGYNAESLHGDLSQQQRDLTMQKFRTRLTQLLVATDVAARGLDVDDLTHVINYSLPDDLENYIHRSGRTGRAGKTGTSISIIHSKELHKVRAIEKVLGKKFTDGTLPSPKEICSKQLFKAIDDIEKADINEEEIAPFMSEIRHHFEYVDKEYILKKIVSMEFGRFLAYYADAPEIERPLTGKARKEAERLNDARRKQRGGDHTPEKGYARLFLNLGKADGFYPGEAMQLLNRLVGGRVKVGHIDLMSSISYIEVSEKDAANVMRCLDGATYRHKTIRCNDANSGRPADAKGDRPRRSDRRDSQQWRDGEGPSRGRNGGDGTRERGRKRRDEGRKAPWRDNKPRRGGFDFSAFEEGFARRKRKK